MLEPLVRIDSLMDDIFIHIGHIDHGKTTLTAAITKFLS